MLLAGVDPKAHKLEDSSLGLTAKYFRATKSNVDRLTVCVLGPGCDLKRIESMSLTPSPFSFRIEFFNDLPSTTSPPRLREGLPGKSSLIVTTKPRSPKAWAALFFFDGSVAAHAELTAKWMAFNQKSLELGRPVDAVFKKFTRFNLDGVLELNRSFYDTLQTTRAHLAAYELGASLRANTSGATAQERVYYFSLLADIVEHLRSSGEALQMFLRTEEIDDSNLAETVEGWVRVMNTTLKPRVPTRKNARNRT